MTKKLLAIVFAATFAACNSNPKTTETTPVPDTTGDAAARAADRAQSMEATGVTDTLMTSDGSKYVKVDPNAPATLAPVASPAPVVRKSTPARSTTTTKRRTTNSSSGSGGTYSGGSGSTGTGTTTSTGSGTDAGTVSTPVPAKKKGWSNSAKGAVIGAGAGAVGGAIISKKKGTGAIIGGVVGAAGGYIIGKNKDKKAAQQ